MTGEELLHFYQCLVILSYPGDPIYCNSNKNELKFLVLLDSVTDAMCLFNTVQCLRHLSVSYWKNNSVNACM